MQSQHLFPTVSDSVKHSITCAMSQQPWLVPKYSVSYIRHKVLSQHSCWGDPEDKCSFPEWFIMLRLHYLAFGVWPNKSPSPGLLNSEVNAHIKIKAEEVRWLENTDISLFYLDFHVFVMSLKSNNWPFSPVLYSVVWKADQSLLTDNTVL